MRFRSEIHTSASIYSSCVLLNIEQHQPVLTSYVTIYRSAPVVTVKAEIIVPDEPLVLNDLPDRYECTVEKETVVVCFNVSLCFNYSLLPEDSVDKFSKNPTLFTWGPQLFQITLVTLGI